MTNWLEKAEQERRRLAAEAAAKSAAEKKQGEEARDTVTQKLQVYHDLGVGQTLEEIRRDIWQGFGSINTFGIDFTQDSPTSSCTGRIGHVLTYSAVTDVTPISAPVLEERYGKYEIPITHTSTDRGIRGDTMIVGYKKKKGKYVLEVGQKSAGSQEEKREFVIRCCLEYSSSGFYNFSIEYSFDHYGGKKAHLTDSDPIVPFLSDFTNKAFLDHAMNPKLPDFAALKERADQKRAENKRPHIYYYDTPKLYSWGD